MALATATTFSHWPSTRSVHGEILSSMNVRFWLSTTVPSATSTLLGSSASTFWARAVTV